jgi:hypothetical protein
MVSNLRFRLAFNNSFIVDGVGKGGGLVLFWDESIKIDLLSYGLHHIDTMVSSSELHLRWRATFVYGEPKVQDRRVMWELLRRIQPTLNALWVMLGDFNEALWQFEHFSKHKRPEQQMIDFREVLSHCNLHDLGFSGLPWTFDNRQ